MIHMGDSFRIIFPMGFGDAEVRHIGMETFHDRAVVE